MLMSGAVVVMAVSRRVGMGVNLAAVVVDADVIFCQTMRDRRVVGKREGNGRAENAKRIKRGKHDCRFAAKGFTGLEQHRVRPATRIEYRGQFAMLPCPQRGASEVVSATRFRGHDEFDTPTCAGSAQRIIAPART